MVWLVLEGLDKVGKSTVCEHYRKKGFDVLHFSKPHKKYYAPGYVGPTYLDDIIEQLIPLMGSNIIFDRSWWGELIWPNVYGRPPLLDNEALDILSEMEQQNDCRRILLHDKDAEAHWERCKRNNEPLTRYQFDMARVLFYDIAEQKNFEILSFKDLLDDPGRNNSVPSNKHDDVSRSTVDVSIAERNVEIKNNKDKRSEEQLCVVALTPEQERLAQANAINDILSKPIVKQKGDYYSVIENKIRHFLNEELAMLLGTRTAVQPVLTNDEVVFIKTLMSKLSGGKK